MHPKPHARPPRILWGLFLAAGLGGTAYAQPPVPQPAPAPQPGDPAAPKERDTGIPDAKVDPKTGAVVVPVGGFVRFDPRVPEPPNDILVSREDFLQVRLDPNNPRVLLFTGRVPGLVQVTLLWQNRPRQVIDVIVQPDFELLRSLIRRTVPTANVEVTPGLGNVLILSGYVTTPQDADIITRLAISQVGGSANNVINAMQVGGVQQVQIDVVIASVNRNELRSRGFDFVFNGRTTAFNSLVSGLLTPPTGFGTGTGGTVTVSPLANLQLGVVGGNSGFFSALRALRAEGLAKFLSEPRVVTQTGRPAFFLSGGQQPTVGPSSGITGPGVVYERVGVQVEVLPVVYGNGQIFLEVNPSNRALGQNVALGTIGAVPSFTEQQARVSVMMESGQTFAIGGLIQRTTSASSTRIPVLGDLPYIGTAFSTVTHNESEDELVILVTPRLVHPMDCNQVPRRLPGMETRSPDDYELFLEGILEAPRGQRKVWNGRCYNAAYKCDPSAANYPCVGNVCYGPNGTMLPAGGACGPAGCAAPGAYPAAAPAVTARPAALPGVAAAPHAAPAAPAVPDPTGPAGTPIAPVVSDPAAPANLPMSFPAVPGVPVGLGNDGGAVGLPPAPVVIPPAPPELPR